MEFNKLLGIVVSSSSICPL